MVLGDGLSRGVIDVELLSDLYDIDREYINDAPPFLKALDEFTPSLFSYLFVFFGCQFDLHIIWLYLIGNDLNL